MTALFNARVRFGAFLVCLGTALSSLATTYYVRHDGNDQASGDATNLAWASLERVNRAIFKPGDHVYFEGGQAFLGQLHITTQHAGNPNAPVVFGSYGSGRARIEAGAGTGILLEGAGGVILENLEVVGSGATNNHGYGINCENTNTHGQRLDFLKLDNLETHGFGIHGILISGTEAGFDHVWVTNCSMHNNLRGGMEVAGRLSGEATNYAHANVHVVQCKAFDNSGDPNYLRNHSGSGIVLYQVENSLMEQCLAWNNGALCRSGGGGVGLWVCASRRVTIQYCQSYANKTSHADGGGFDIDGGCEDCILQYNYSHDNDGPGLMVYSYNYAPHRNHGCIVRFNISENDSRKGAPYAGLWVKTDGSDITGLEIYNNTVVVGSWTESAACIFGRGIEARLRNNIFFSSGNAIPLRVQQPESRMRFENNLYWREGGPAQIAWDTNLFSNLKEWRDKTHQESVNGKETGLSQFPQLTVHPPQQPVGEYIELAHLKAFRPLPQSPVLVCGIDLKGQFGLDAGPRDLLGSPIPASGPIPLGAICSPAQSQ
jgi:hypothetical protein